MKWPTFLLALILAMTGCVSSAPLPDAKSTHSAVDYAERIVDASTANLDRLLNTTERGAENGYQWYEGWWCPRHDAIWEVGDVQNLFAQYCATHGGTWDLRFCRSATDPDAVQFAATFRNTDECSSGRAVTIFVIEPDGAAMDRNYLAKLRQMGYQSSLDHARRQQEMADALSRAEDEAEQRRAAMRVAAQGTQICRRGIVNYTVQLPSQYGASQKSKPGTLVAQLDGFSEDGDRILFRVLSIDIPAIRQDEIQLAHSYSMSGFFLQPGSQYWDLIENWSPCGT